MEPLQLGVFLLMWHQELQEIRQAAARYGLSISETNPVEFGNLMLFRLEATYFGQNMENQMMYPKCMDLKPHLKVEENFA